MNDHASAYHEARRSYYAMISEPAELQQQINLLLSEAADHRLLAGLYSQLGNAYRRRLEQGSTAEVDQAIEWVNELAFARPLFIEEPTSPDDVIGHRRIREGVAPVKVATGEMCQNRIIFKQFISHGALDFVQVDSCRLGGLNEVLAVQLMAAKFGLPVWPHAGGVGLCEYVQHLSMIDFVAITGKKDDKRIEFVDHLHEHFVDPVEVENGAYKAPNAPGFSIEMKSETLRNFEFQNPVAD